MKIKSQLRQDLVSGDWIVNSPSRAKRPHSIIEKNLKRKVAPKSTCPFENPQKTGHKEPYIQYDQNGDWAIQVIENKFPTFIHNNTCPVFSRNGPYQVADAIGHHDLVITRDHNDNFAELSKNRARQVFEVFRDRYLMFLNDECISYVSIFHNWGPKAGASVYHPHYQIIAIPVIPPDIDHSLRGSARYFRNNKGKCVHCTMINFERKNKKRVLYENAGAIAFTPFVSKEPFEVRIFPKKHLSYFENTLNVDLDCVVDALQVVLKKLTKKLKDPDYNFFIHTAPIKNKKKYKHYHWHVEIIPKLSISAGFELSTGVEVNIVDSDEAASLLRK